MGDDTGGERERDRDTEDVASRSGVEWCVGRCRDLLVVLGGFLLGFLKVGEGGGVCAEEVDLVMVDVDGVELVGTEGLYGWLALASMSK